jgi:hypothetical protein
MTDLARSALWTLLTALLLVAPAPAAAQEDAQVLIAPFPPGTVSPEDGKRLDDALRAGAATLPGVLVQPRATTESALEGMRQMGLTCHPEETRCLVQLGALAGAARVISSEAVRDGESFRVTLRLIDVAGKSELRRIDGVVQSRELAAGLEGLATGLLLPSRYKGQLGVTVNEAGAMILIDGELRGSAPLPEPLAVRAGKVTVRVEKDGFAPVEQVVVVPWRGEASVQVSLTPGEGEDAAYGGRTRVLVLDLLAQGDGLPNPRTLASLVAVELARDPGLDVLSGTDVDQLIAAQEAGMEIDCQDTGCLADLAGAFDVPFIVHGDIGTVGSVLVVHLDVFDAQRVETVARTSVENTNRDKLPEELKVAARRLLEYARAARADFSPVQELPPVAATGGSPLTVPAWTLIGVGAGVTLGAAATTVVYTVLWNAAQSGADLWVQLDEDEKSRAEAQRIKGDIDRFNNLQGPYVLPIAIGATITGAAALATGGVLLVVGGLEE